MDGPRAFPDTTVGNITYITLKTPRLPLLLPLYYLGFPTLLLDLVEPALTVMVDWGYDRSISPGTPTTARLIPRINPITAVADLARAVAEGVHNVIGDLTPAPPAVVPSAANAVSVRRMPDQEPATGKRALGSDRQAPEASRTPARDRTASPGAARSSRAAS